MCWVLMLDSTSSCVDVWFVCPHGVIIKLEKYKTEGLDAGFKSCTLINESVLSASDLFHIV